MNSFRDEINNIKQDLYHNQRDLHLVSEANLENDENCMKH